MSESKKSKGIKFVPVNDVSEKTKLKLDELVKKKGETLNKLVEDYRAGKLAHQS